MSSTRYPCLVYKLPEDDSPSQVFSIPEGRSVLGRRNDSNLVLKDTSVSRVHSALVLQGDRLWIRAESSSNPTRVQGQPIQETELFHEDRIQLGRVKLQVFLYPEKTPKASPAGSRKTSKKAKPKRKAPATSSEKPKISVTVPRYKKSSTSYLMPLVVVSSILIGGGFLIFLNSQKEPSPPPDSKVITTLPKPTSPSKKLNGSSKGDKKNSPTSLAKAEPQQESKKDSLATNSKLSAESVADPELNSEVEIDQEGSKEGLPKVVERLGASSASEAYFEGHVVPFLSRFCTKCHGEEEQEGDIALDEFPDFKATLEDRELWELVATQLKKKKMPPENSSQPSGKEVQAIVGWVDAAVLGKKAGDSLDPGRVTIRRLNNTEYNNTIRDLVGLDLKPAKDFPADEIGYGFDNIGDILSIPPLLMEKYIATAEKIVEEVWKNKEAKDKIYFRQPKRKTDYRAAARAMLSKFARRAFRRPMTTSEYTNLYKLITLALKEEDDFELGIKLALQAILSSPHFLFRVEIDSKPDDPTEIHAISDYELASRLSYFLWSTMPDDELLDLAKKRQLGRRSTLRKQALRMLQDEKAQGMVESFASLWLGVRQLQNASPDFDSYPNFNDDLRLAMEKETQLFFTEIMKKDLSVLLFINSDFTFLNEKLANHYGIEGVTGDQFRKVQIDDGRRGGVLTQGTVLTITSNPTRTSPVKRGKWILEEILGSPPPPPPPGADSLDEEKVESGELTLRDSLKKHREDPKCATCHEKMDTLGLAFENFDGVGGWRRFEGNSLIDAQGTLPDGRSFKSVAELKDILLKNYSHDFCRCLVEKMLTFALGRGIEYSDMDEVERIARNLARNDYKFSELILQIVQSDLFLKRRGERRS